MRLNPCCLWLVLPLLLVLAQAEESSSFFDWQRRYFNEDQQQSVLGRSAWSSDSAARSAMMYNPYAAPHYSRMVVSTRVHRLLQHSR